MSEDLLYLAHIQECIDRIQAFAKDGKESFFGDLRTQGAILRNLQVLAESATRLSEDLRNAHSDVDWKGVRGFRNVLVHDYLGIDISDVWDIVEQDLPLLKSAVEAMLNEVKGAES